MLEFLTTSDSVPDLRVGSTGRLEGKYEVATFLKKVKLIEDGWYDLLLPEQASSIYATSYHNVMIIGKESGSIYTITKKKWAKLPPLPQSVAKVFCEAFSGAYAIVTVTGVFFYFWADNGRKRR